MLADERHDTFEQHVIGDLAVAVAVAEGLHSDDVDIGDDELAAGLPAAVQFAVKVAEARGQRACSCRRVDLRDREMSREHLAVCKRAPSLLGCLFAVLSCVAAVLCGQPALLGGLRALLRGALALSAGTHDDLCAGDHARAVKPRGFGVALIHLEIPRVGRLVSRQPRDIARVGAVLTPVGSVHPPLVGLLAPAVRRRMSRLTSCGCGLSPDLTGSRSPAARSWSAANRSLSEVV